MALRTGGEVPGREDQAPVEDPQGVSFPGDKRQYSHGGGQRQRKIPAYGHRAQAMEDD